jgi:hypothetical protein
MKHIIKAFSMLAAVLLIAVSCETEMVEPIDIFALEQGGYMRTISGTSCVTSANVSKRNMGGTSLNLVNEAVTPNKGANFASYELQIRYVGATAATTTALTALRTINASDYKPDATTGYPRHTLIITGAEALAATRLDTARIATGRFFEVVGTMKLNDGKSFNAANTGDNIKGGAFYCSPFRYVLNVTD